MPNRRVSSVSKGMMGRLRKVNEEQGLLYRGRIPIPWFSQAAGDCAGVSIAPWKMCWTMPELPLSVCLSKVCALYAETKNNKTVQRPM